MNKITNTKVGDNINFFVNGVEDNGIVVKMNNAYVTVVKDGKFKDIQINETFFVKDIVLNKTWDDMDDGERLDVLSKARVPSPRYVTKTWNQIPKELQVLLTKNNSSNVSATEGKDDDMNETKRIFDKADEPQPTEKASSGDINYKRVPSSNSAHASSDAMSTDPKSDSGGFKINSKIGTEGVGEHGKVGQTRQRGVGEREPSTEEQRGEKRGTKQTEGQAEANSKEIASSSVRLFSGYNEQTGEKEYKNQAWVSWLADRKDDVMKDAPLESPKNSRDDSIRQQHGEGTRSHEAKRSKVRSEIEDNVHEARLFASGQQGKKLDDIGSDYSNLPHTPKGGKAPSDLEKAIEKLNQLKSNIENSVHGNAGREPNSGVSTSTNFDAPKDYEGASHSGIRPEQFKHENKKPEIKKEKLELGDTKPSDTHGGGNKYDTQTQSKTIKGRAVDQEKDKKI